MPRGRWSLWSDVPEPARGELRRIYRDLRGDYRLARAGSKRLARRWAKQAAEAWAVADALSEEAAVLAVRRRAGRGRRPSEKHVKAAGKRQGLQLQTLDGALARLEGYVGRNGHPRDPLREILGGGR